MERQIKQWQQKNPKTTLTEIENAIDKELAKIRQDALEELVQEREFLQARYLALVESNVYTEAVYSLGEFYLNTNKLDLAIRQLELSAALFEVSELTENTIKANLLLSKAFRLSKEFSLAMETI